jgi:hypothetical protein
MIIVGVKYVPEVADPALHQHLVVMVSAQDKKTNKINSLFIYNFPVLGVRDVLVRIRILTDPYPTPFFSDFKDAKKLFFSLYFSLITYPQAHYLQS